jgi:hypothetical protein
MALGRQIFRSFGPFRSFRSFGANTSALRLLSSLLCATLVGTRCRDGIGFPIPSFGLS